jgi:hypothetical protein
MYYFLKKENYIRNIDVKLFYVEFKQNTLILNKKISLKLMYKFIYLKFLKTDFINISSNNINSTNLF